MCVSRPIVLALFPGEGLWRGRELPSFPLLAKWLNNQKLDRAWWNHAMQPLAPSKVIHVIWFTLKPEITLIDNTLAFHFKESFFGTIHSLDAAIESVYAHHIKIVTWIQQFHSQLSTDIHSRAECTPGVQFPWFILQQLSSCDNTKRSCALQKLCIKHIGRMIQPFNLLSLW